MGFRFRKSIRILPGLRLNLSKSGVSASIGAPGATVNLSDRGTRATVGLPGTGLSYTEKQSDDQGATKVPAAGVNRLWLWILLAMLGLGVWLGV